MLEFIENLYLSHQLLFWLISIIITVLITWLFAKNAKAQILYCSHDNNIVKNNKSSIDGLKIKFKNKSIETLSVSRFLIFNNGKKAVMGKDVSARDVFGIKLTKGEILTAKIIDYNDNFSEPKLVLAKKNELKITFHHINPKGAIVIQIAHTAPNNSSIKLECCAAGLEKTKKISINQSSLKARFVAGIGLLIYASIFFGILLNKSAYMKYLSTCNTSKPADNIIWMAGICVVIMLFQFIYSMGYTWKWRYWGRFASRNNFFDRKN